MKLFFQTLIILCSAFFYAQNTEHTKKQDTLYYPQYPDGVYASKTDFINKTPSSVDSIYPMQIYKLERIPETELVHNCFFFSQKTRSKIRNVFAISYKGQLFFQVKAILKNRNKEDRAQKSTHHNSFVRVFIGGDNYLYTEAELGNQWAVGTAANFGIVGNSIAQDLINGKGVVWDYKNKEFNIFKSCKDFNNFIEDKGPDYVLECESHQPHYVKVREAINSIK
nr:hypothetical protein [uncultured Psychroserpens sp.]